VTDLSKLNVLARISLVIRTPFIISPTFILRLAALNVFFIFDSHALRVWVGAISILGCAF
jgi:hypothetical protein